MDCVYWVCWYDLPESDRQAYFSWLNERYIPAVLERHGVCWAAHYASEENVVPLGGGKGRIGHVKRETVPTGDRFILIVGASVVQAFANPSPNQFHARLPAGDQRMLAMRQGERVNVMVEQARADGHAAASHREAAPGPCIQLGSFNAPPEEEDELMAWYAQWRLPSMQDVPGCIRVRKLVSVSGWAKHACLYEFTSLEKRNEYFVHYERGNPEMEARSKRAVRNTVHAPGSANVAQRIALAYSGTLAHAPRGQAE